MDGTTSFQGQSAPAPAGPHFQSSEPPQNRPIEPQTFSEILSYWQRHPLQLDGRNNMLYF